MREAPASARRMRKKSQERALRSRCRSLGMSNMRTKKAPMSALRILAPVPSGDESVWLGVALIFDRYPLRLQAVDFAHAGKGAAHMRNSNGAADDQSDVECLNHFFAVPAFFAAADQVIGDAIV